MITTLKTNVTRLILPILAILILLPRQKEIDTDTGNVIVLPDFDTKVSSSVSGFVTDENDAPVMGSTVSNGKFRFCYNR